MGIVEKRGYHRFLRFPQIKIPIQSGVSLGQFFVLRV
jgi:hypothetical protein